MTTSPLPTRQSARLQEAASLNRQGRLDEARAVLDALAVDFPEHPGVNELLGINHLKARNPARALHFLMKANLASDSPLILANIAVAFGQLNENSKAIDYFRQAIKLKPDFAEAYFNLGNLLLGQGNLDEAEESFGRATDLRPDDARYQFSRGIAHYMMGRLQEALVDFDRAIRINPGYANAYSNRGTILNRLGDYSGALEAYNRAIQLSRSDADLFFNRANVLKNLGRTEQALADYASAVNANPDHAEALAGYGSLLLSIGHYGEALARLDQAYRLKPEIPYLVGQLVSAKMRVCDWSDLTGLLGSVAQGVEEGRRTIHPFPYLALVDDPQLQRAAASVYVQDTVGPIVPLADASAQRETGKIRLGYFSADFHDHATMHLMAELFERHDRTRFHVVAFSFGPDKDDSWRRRARSAFDEFLDVRSTPDAAVAHLARERGIDIAIDLKGFTQDCRPGIFAHRAAPVQVNYLGYPGTMAASFMDYVIADEVVIPLGKEAFYSEKIVRLPGSYQVNDSQPRQATTHFTRRDVGLPEQAFVFCCFNHSHKILPEVFDVWMGLLSRVEGSVLWLFESDALANANLRKEAEARGINGNRLVFAARLPIGDHLARIPLADLFLDTFPYNAHTTASDALRVGLPLVTHAGESFASRVAASLLEAVGMAELVAHSREEYAMLALELAAQPDKLRAVREKLTFNLGNAPLYDIDAFTRHIETAYQAMHRRSCAGLPPESIELGDA